MMLFPMLSVNILIVAIFVGIIVISNFFTIIRRSEIRALNQSVEYHGAQLQRLLTDLSVISFNMATGIGQDAQAIFGDKADIGDALRTKPDLAASFVNLNVTRVVDALKMNKATGAFVVLDASAANPGQGLQQSGSMTAIYLNDEDLSAAHADNTDLMLLYGHKNIARNMKIPLDNYWKMEWGYDDFESLDFLLKPYMMANQHASLRTEQLGYWSGPCLRRDGREVFYYAVPLVDDMNRCYGLTGIEVSADQLKSTLSLLEFNYGENNFYMIMDGPQGPFSGAWNITKGSYAARNSVAGFDNIKTETLPEYGERMFGFAFPTGERATAAYYAFRLYYAGSPFADEDNWMLVYGVANQTLFSSSQSLTLFFMVAVIAALVIGIFSSIVAANWLVTPFSHLSEQVADVDPDEEIKLDKTRIKEIDVLIESIEQLSEDLIEAGARTLETIEMIEMPIGFFEIDPAKKRVFITDRIRDMFGFEAKTGSDYITVAQWDNHYRNLVMYRDDTGQNTYFLDASGQRTSRWLRIKTIRNREKTSGIIMDITGEVLEKKRLEHERDTDPLTGLLNRHAFYACAYDEIRRQPDGIGAMIFADLDNLKYVNDTYGHDFGDRYIQAAATAFSLYADYKGVVARISGDEFAVFIYGYTDKNELRDVILENFDRTLRTTIDLPDATRMKIRCSLGYAWYPQDSYSLEQLLKYADYAMYEVKKTSKGSAREFAIASYNQNAYLIEKNEEFNHLIDDNMVEYAFQPIVDARTGAVFAYEALMRPQSGDFSDPNQVIEMARTQSKLYEIEKMTIFNIYRWVSHNFDRLDGRKLFFNLISDQILDDKDMAELESVYARYFSHTVAEISDKETSSLHGIKEKVDWIRKLGCGIAVDGLGSGYSGESGLLVSEPNYLKIDIALIRDIQSEKGKQELIHSVIDYAHTRRIKVVAKGLETADETRVMIALGADYLQGFYIAMPSFEIEDVDRDLSDRIRSIAAGLGK
jgi:diguanylate cyclase (GGDEF)-like protein